MMVYVASSSQLLDRVKKVVAALEEQGHKVPCKWWTYWQHDDSPKEEWYERDDVERALHRNLNGIRMADAFVLVAPPDEERKFNGANIEFGYAHAHDTPCFSVGVLEKSAMYHPMTRCKDIVELLDTLNHRWRSLGETGPDDILEEGTEVLECIDCKVRLSGDGDGIPHPTWNPGPCGVNPSES